MAAVVGHRVGTAARPAAHALPLEPVLSIVCDKIQRGSGATRQWTDTASAKYDGLLDVIRKSCGFIIFMSPRRLSGGQDWRDPKAPAPTARWRRHTLA